MRNARRDTHFRGVRVRIAAQPEVLDKLVALLVVAEMLERLHLLVGDDPPDILIHPLLVDTLQLLFQSLLLSKRSLSLSGRFNGSGFSTVAGPLVTPSGPRTGRRPLRSRNPALQ